MFCPDRFYRASSEGMSLKHLSDAFVDFWPMKPMMMMIPSASLDSKFDPC